MAEAEVECDDTCDRTPLLMKNKSKNRAGCDTDVTNIVQRPIDLTQSLPWSVTRDYLFGAHNIIETEDNRYYGNSSLSYVTDYERTTSPTKPFDDIVCVFVVAFDTRAGNIIEWCLPQSSSLDGIEFKAMASGSHWVQTDFIYFKRDKLYGLACFENMPVDNAVERGARMKSVGILGTSYTSLHQHQVFLQQQVRFLLENPGSYSSLETFYEDKKGTLSPSNFSDSDDGKNCSFDSFPQSSPILPLMRITHPAGCFSQFMNFFGDQVFLLWKLALLRKRIVFFSPPPIGVVCYRVYCTTCLAAHSIVELESWVTQPLFYVNVADVEVLEEEKVYIACTTEKIFESKKTLYDMYVDNQNLKAATPMLQKLMNVNMADKVKYGHLNQLRSECLSPLSEDSDDIDQESWFIKFFVSLNDHLFTTLLDVSRTQEKQWTDEHMHTVGLDPIGDRVFVMELAETYGIDIIMMVDNPCCPKTTCCRT